MFQPLIFLLEHVLAVRSKRIFSQLKVEYSKDSLSLSPLLQRRSTLYIPHPLFSLHHYNLHHRRFSLSLPTLKNGASPYAFKALVRRHKCRLAVSDHHARKLSHYTAANGGAPKCTQNPLPPRVHHLTRLRHRRLLPPLPPAASHQQPFLSQLPPLIPHAPLRRKAPGETQVHEPHRRPAPSLRRAEHAYPDTGGGGPVSRGCG